MPLDCTPAARPGRGGSSNPGTTSSSLRLHECDSESDSDLEFYNEIELHQPECDVDSESDPAGSDYFTPSPQAELPPLQTEDDEEYLFPTRSPFWDPRSPESTRAIEGPRDAHSTFRDYLTFGR